MRCNVVDGEILMVTLLTELIHNMLIVSPELNAIHMHLAAGFYKCVPNTLSSLATSNRGLLINESVLLMKTEM